ncbi:MAG: cache domain-containing protein [Candidatus Taylorbacteria bacterium]
MSIKLKLSLVIISVLTIVGSMMWGILYWQNNRVLNDHMAADIKNAVSYNSQLVNAYMDRIQSSVTSLASDPSIVDALVSRDKRKLEQASLKFTTIVESENSVEDIALFEVRGSGCIVIATSKVAQSIVGQNFSERDYCKGVLKIKETYVSSAFVGVVTKHPNISVVVPVENSNGEMIGFVMGVVKFDELRGYLWDLQNDSKVEIMDRNGVMFLDTTSKIETLGNLSTVEDAELMEIEQSISNGVHEWYFRDDDNFIGYKFNGSMTIIYEQSATSLMGLSHSLNYTILASLLVLIILSFLVIFIFLDSITNRISRLSKISSDIANGQFNIELNEKDMKAKDETAILAMTFVDMAKKLKDLYDNLDNKVKERTSELEKTGADLKKALDESSRLNKVMVGREIEMAKLKKGQEQQKNS